MNEKKQSSYAPIVVFCFKRTETLERLISALLLNPEAQFSDLYLYSDAPRSSGDFNQVEAVRKYLKTIIGFKSINIVEREVNLGLARSFISGITETLTKHSSGIFLEDDNFISKSFLQFMNESLKKYEFENRVGCISGFSYPMPIRPKQGYFLNGAETWSMATWRNVWEEFEQDADRLIQIFENRNLRKKLNMYGFNFYEMLLLQSKNKIDSWGVRWWASAVSLNLLCFYPPRPYCINVGWGMEGTHVTEIDPIMSKVENMTDDIFRVFPKKIRASSAITLNMRFMNIILMCSELIGSAVRRFRNEI